MKMPWRRGTADSHGAITSPERVLADLANPPNGVSPTLVAWASVVDATGLSDRTVKNAERFLQMCRKPMTTTLGSRRETALRIRSNIEHEVSPPPPPTIGNMDVIATALNMRRRQLGYGQTGPDS